MTGAQNRRQRAGRSRLAAFLPNPNDPHATFGSRELPGFHTTRDRDVAIAYACAKVLHFYTVEPEADDGEVLAPAFVKDYPVVLELDMRGLEPKPDYDARAFTDPVRWVLENALSAGGIETVDDVTVEALWDAAEEIQSGGYTEDSIDPAGSGMEWLGILFSPDRYASRALSVWLEEDVDLALEAARAVLAKKPLPGRALMLAVDQYRYEETVGEERVSRVYFARPVASGVANDHEDEDPENIGARWPGFTIGSYDDYDPRFDIELVWTGPRARDVGFKPEFHGTTLARLGLAAPGIRKYLPWPLSPPLDREAFRATVKLLKGARRVG